MPHLICCQVMKCRYLPLKDMCPADMFEIYVSFSLFFFFVFPTSFFKIQIWSNKRQFEIFPGPPHLPPERIFKTIEVKNVYANAVYIRACTGC